MIIFALAGLAALVFGGAVALFVPEFGEPPAPDAFPAEVTEVPLGVEPVVLEEVPDPGTSEPIPLDEQEQTSTNPSDPCAGESKYLVTKPDPVHLMGTKGSFTMFNCASETVSWSAQATKPWVTLTAKAGIIGSGKSKELQFTVDTSDLPTGPYSFKVKVSQPGYSQYVDAHGTKLGGLVNPGPTPTIGGLVYGGPTGCAAKCITKAWLTPRPGGADVTLEVKTTTPARIGAQVSTQAPKHDQAGNPYFSSADVTVTSTGYRTSWTTVLKPLKPATKYYIIVAAKDAKDAISYESGSFKSPNAATGLAASEPGGCAVNCVKKALLVPKAGEAEVSVETYVPAKMAVFANDSPIANSGNEFRTQWTTTLHLEYDTAYEIRLEVTDEQGGRQVHTASVTTPPQPQAGQRNVLITFHKVVVTDDGDDSFWNRTGELRFRFEVNGERQIQLDTAEHKVKATETLSLGERSVLINNAPNQIPVRVQGLERDGDLPGFCSAGQPVYPEPSGHIRIDNCYELDWNTAEVVIDLDAAQAGGALPPCFGFDATGDICLAFAADGARPKFQVFMTVDFVD